MKEGPEPACGKHRCMGTGPSSVRMLAGAGAGSPVGKRDLKARRSQADQA